MTSISVLVALMLAASAHAAAPQLFEGVEPHMGTLASVRVYAASADQAKAAFRAAFDRIAELDRTLSDYKPDSELNCICRDAVGKPVAVSADLFRVLEESQRVAEESGGAFDVTQGPVIRLWRQARRDRRMPAPEALRSAMAHSGYRKLHLDRASRTVMLDQEGMQLDVGGIAKGYAADEALVAIARLGIRQALVAISGDLAFGDPPPGQSGWKIGIEGGRVLELRNAAVSTAGASEQYAEIDGRRYSHIIDPRTGMGLTDSITVTVVARRGIDADALDTAVSVLGPERGRELIAKRTAGEAEGMKTIWIAALTVSAFAQDHKTWSDYAGAADSAQYSALKQIDRTNVGRLQVAWTYPIGDGRKYNFNPLVVDGVMYVLSKGNSIVALDAATGKEIWTWRDSEEITLITHRGINYWESRDRSDRRLLFAANHMLRAIDARTGKPIASFGTNGRVDLREGLGRDPSSLKLVQSTTPGRVFEDLLILGSATNEGYTSGPGDVRAFDVRTGKVVWTFHTIPHPGEFGYETWPKDAWKTVGGANVWGEFTLDAARGIVYAPTASAKYNFYGADRLGANLFGDCLLALDARTGKRLWHFQMVHHDIWDYDDATAPKLLTVKHDGKMVDVVAQLGKQGFVWVFEREKGAPLWPIEERPVPRSDMPHESAWSTQPFPVKPPPFARQKFTVDDLSPYLTPEDRARFRDALLSSNNKGLFTPPSTQPTVQMPGNNGGANWGGAAVDPTKGLLYVVSKDMPAMLKLEQDKEHPERYTSGFNFMIASNGMSPIGPPWTSITTYDLNEGTILWKRPLGDVPELAAKGIHNTGVHYPKVGPVVTAGGLIFTGSRDKWVRALDQDTGKTIWETQLPAAMEGIPAVYEVAGREYVVFCAAAQAGLTPATQEKIEGAYVAFALARE
jgi:quinoprotein glucose dehydrogenase